MSRMISFSSPRLPLRTVAPPTGNAWRMAAPVMKQRFKRARPCSRLYWRKAARCRPSGGDDASDMAGDDRHLVNGNGPDGPGAGGPYAALRQPRHLPYGDHDQLAGRAMVLRPRV